MSENLSYVKQATSPANPRTNKCQKQVLLKPLERIVPCAALVKLIARSFFKKKQRVRQEMHINKEKTQAFCGVEAHRRIGTDYRPWQTLQITLLNLHDVLKTRVCFTRIQSRHAIKALECISIYKNRHDQVHFSEE